ncbi:MAG TPA: hypothetical protein PLK94_05975 [Alphaproteobacteria bacterium]|nr:hypothetical protein [Alphaproteobacteria bacterium]HOO50821.1 hypothetical protein [Alphaproteobacteria bacterium]
MIGGTFIGSMLLADWAGSKFKNLASTNKLSSGREDRSGQSVAAAQISLE